MARADTLLGVVIEAEDRFTGVSAKVRTEMQGLAAASKEQAEASKAVTTSARAEAEAMNGAAVAAGKLATASEKKASADNKANQRRESSLQRMQEEVERQKSLSAAYIAGGDAVEAALKQQQEEAAVKKLGSRATDEQKQRAVELTRALADQKAQVSALQAAEQERARSEAEAASNVKADQADASKRQDSISALRAQVAEGEKLAAAQAKGETAVRELTEANEREAAVRALGSKATKEEREEVLRLTEALQKQRSASGDGATGAAGQSLGKVGDTLESMGGPAGEAVGKFNALKGIFSSTTIVAGGFAAGLAAVALGLVHGISTAGEFERVYGRLDAVLKSTGNTTGLTGKQIRAFSQDLADATLATKASVVQASTSLSIIGSVSGDMFKGTLTQAQDLSALFGSELQENVKLLGRAYASPIQGIGELREAGILFTAQQTQQVTKLVENGRVLEAQKILYDQVAKASSGAAKAEAGGQAGAWDSLSDGWVRLGESIDGWSKGSSIITGSVKELAGILNGVSAWFEKDTRPEISQAQLNSDQSASNSDGASLAAKRMSTDIALVKNALESVEADHAGFGGWLAAQFDGGANAADALTKKLGELEEKLNVTLNGDASEGGSRTARMLSAEIGTVSAQLKSLQDERASFGSAGGVFASLFTDIDKAEDGLKQKLGNLRAQLAAELKNNPVVLQASLDEASRALSKAKANGSSVVDWKGQKVDIDSFAKSVDKAKSTITELRQVNAAAGKDDSFFAQWDQQARLVGEAVPALKTALSDAYSGTLKPLQQIDYQNEKWANQIDGLIESYERLNKESGSRRYDKDIADLKGMQKAADDIADSLKKAAMIGFDRQIRDLRTAAALARAQSGIISQATGVSGAGGVSPRVYVTPQASSGATVDQAFKYQNHDFSDGGFEKGTPSFDADAMSKALSGPGSAATTKAAEAAQNSAMAAVSSSESADAALDLAKAVLSTGGAPEKTTAAEVAKGQFTITEDQLQKALAGATPSKSGSSMPVQATDATSAAKSVERSQRDAADAQAQQQLADSLADTGAGVDTINDALSVLAGTQADIRNGNANLGFAQAVAGMEQGKTAAEALADGYGQSVEAGQKATRANEAKAASASLDADATEEQRKAVEAATLAQFDANKAAEEAQQLAEAFPSLDQQITDYNALATAYRESGEAAGDLLAQQQALEQSIGDATRGMSDGNASALASKMRAQDEARRRAEQAAAMASLKGQADDIKDQMDAYGAGSKKAVEAALRAVELKKSIDEATRGKNATDAAEIGAQMTALDAQAQQLEKTQKAWEKQQELAGNVGDAFAGAFEDAIYGANSFMDVLKSLAMSLSKIGFESFVTNPLQNAISGMMGGMGGGTGSGGGNIFSSIFGGIQSFFGGGLSKYAGMTGLFANGGDVGAGQAVIVGDKGGRSENHELFVPKTAGTIYPDVGAAIGGGGVTVNNNWYGSASPSNTPERSQAQMTARVLAATKQANRIR